MSTLTAAVRESTRVQSPYAAAHWSCPGRSWRIFPLHCTSLMQGKGETHPGLCSHTNCSTVPPHTATPKLLTQPWGGWMPISFVEGCFIHRCCQIKALLDTECKRFDSPRTKEEKKNTQLWYSASMQRCQFFLAGCIEKEMNGATFDMKVLKSLSKCNLTNEKHKHIKNVIVRDV